MFVNLTELSLTLVPFGQVQLRDEDCVVLNRNSVGENYKYR